jgi:predicted permease
MRFPWTKSETDLQQEIAHHLHHLAAEYERQGHSREEALRLARKEFGGSEQVKEQCRDERRWAGLSGLRQDAVFGARMLRRTPVITLAAVLSLALGIGANAAIGSLMDIVLWRDLPVPNPKQLTLVNWQGHQYPRELMKGATGSGSRQDGWVVADFFSYPAFREFRKSVAPMASLAAHVLPRETSVSFGGQPTIAEVRRVSGNFFATLQVRSQQGRLLSDDDDRAGAPATAVLSHRFWARAVGASADAIGKTINLNQRPFIVVGVLESGFYGLYPGDSTEIYTPLHQFSDQGKGHPQMEDAAYWGTQLIARRADGVTQDQIRPVLDTIFPATWTAQPKDASKAPKIRLDDGQRGLGFLRREFRNPLLVLGGLVTLLLVIACTNIANLLLARSTSRQKEVAMRVSLGCSQLRLMRQFLTESALLALLGGAASVLVAYLTANLLGQFLAGRERLPIAVTLDFRILATVCAATVMALLLFGLYPAWYGSRVSSAAWLKESAGSKGMSRSRSRAGRILVLAQMALSVVLVMAAVVFTRNLLAIQSADPGFDRRGLILFGIRPGTSGYEAARLQQFYFNLEQTLRETPGVAGAGLASVRPMNIGGRWDTARIDKQDDKYNASINGVTPGYLPLYVRQMTAGRNISWADIASRAKVAVISDDLAKKLGGPGVLGRTLTLGDREPQFFEIVGIAPTFAPTSMKERPHAVWLPLANNSLGATVVLRTSQPPQTMLTAIRQAMAGIDRNLPMIDLITMDEQIAKGLQRERMFATLCGGFGILALVLSVVGLYGVIAYRTSQRRGEIGLRLALGATTRDVTLMVFREGAWLALAGMLIGIPIVWFGSKYLEKELFQMKPMEPLSFSLSLSVLLVAALTAVAIPAIRAAMLPPTETLRQE